MHRSCQHILEILPSKLTKEEKEWFIKLRKVHFRISHQTIRNILKEAGLYESIYEKNLPAKRFEMENFGELVQMDSSCFSGLCGYKRDYLRHKKWSWRVYGGEMKFYENGLIEKS